MLPMQIIYSLTPWGWVVGRGWHGSSMHRGHWEKLAGPFKTLELAEQWTKQQKR